MKKFKCELEEHEKDETCKACDGGIYYGVESECAKLNKNKKEQTTVEQLEKEIERLKNERNTVLLKLTMADDKVERFKCESIDLDNVFITFETKITDEEAIKEGLKCKDHFIYIWDSIYKDTIYSSGYNPFVWIYEFEKVRSE